MRWLTKLLHTAFPDKTMQIDLHGMRVPQALETVRQTVSELEKRGGRVRIICGKGLGSPGGVGVLREVVGFHHPNAPEAVEREYKDLLASLS